MTGNRRIEIHIISSRAPASRRKQEKLQEISGMQNKGIDIIYIL